MAKSLHKFILSVAILFGITKSLPDFLTLSQAKELLQLFITILFGLMAIFIASIFSAFNTKESKIVKFLAKQYREIMFIGALITVSLMTSFLLLSKLIIVPSQEVKTSLILLPQIAMTFSLVYVTSIATSLITETLRNKNNELMDFSYQEWKDELEKKYKDKKRQE